MGFFITQARGEDEQIRYHRSTPNGEYIVMDTTMQGERVRLLLVDGIQESSTHLDPERKYEPLFRYLVFLQQIVEQHPDPKNVLLIGGAGFSYPKLFFSSGQTGELTVVEMDERMIRLARRWFYLNDLEKEYDLVRTGRLKICCDEGMHFLKHTDRKWDVILNDAYLGNVPDQGLLSDEGIALCKSHLAPKGILAVNIITPLAGPDCMRGIIVRGGFGAYCNNATLYPCDPARPAGEKQNCMLVGW